MPSILLVEDDAALASGFARALGARSAGAWQVQHAASISAGKTLARSARFDLAIVDLGLPDGSGIDLIRELAVSPTRAVAFTIFDDRERVLGALRSGAVGYLLKDEPVERVVTQVEECLDGHFPVSSRVARYLLELCRPAELESPLTAREHDVLGCLERGDSYAECARRLGITLGTVQTHVKSLYRKLEVSSRAEATAWASRHRG
ncbi:MAG: response regulator transcription factor [Polyangiaceae bacterium]|jgi:DNA-binding NarL/FixJ family response regulator|nr:response regulator transcription factor [Polyangiaceae bacterium]